MTALLFRIVRGACTTDARRKINQRTADSESGWVHAGRSKQVFLDSQSSTFSSRPLPSCRHGQRALRRDVLGAEGGLLSRWLVGRVDCGCLSS
eukprot:9502952-Pyramimonas_sp.AAC.1